MKYPTPQQLAPTAERPVPSLTGHGDFPSASGRPPRDTAIDLLKIIAIFGVLLLHSLAPFFDGGKSPSPAGLFQCYLIQSCSIFAVPVFVMCSGAFLLGGGKDQPPLAFYVKRLPKILVPLFVWSIVYFIYKHGPTGLFTPRSVARFLRDFLEARVIGNFWFLYMLVGVYLSAPFLQRLMHATTRAQQWLFAGLCLGGPGICLVFRPVVELQLGFSYSVFTPFVGYFVLGHLLQTADPPVRHKKTVFLPLAAAMMGLTLAGQWLVHPFGQDYQFMLLDYPLPNAAIMASALFLGVRAIRFSISDAWRARISLVGRATYGIYLTHILAIFLLKIGTFGTKLVVTDFPPLLGAPIIAIPTFALSLVMVLALSKIPLLRKTVGY